MARARHQPLERRAGHPARRDDRPRLHARADDRRSSTACVVRSERMRENIDRGLGLHASSRVLVALVDDGGLSREEAYAIVQRASLRAADERAPAARPAGRRPGRRPAAVARAARRLLRRRGVPAPRPRGHRPARRARRRAWRSAAAARRRWSRCCAESFLRSGKVRDLYALDDGRLLLVASDRISRVRRRAADRDPRQGPRPHRPVAVLVRRDGRRSSPTTCSATDPADLPPTVGGRPAGRRRCAAG